MTDTMTGRDVQAATILERSVCLTLTCHYLGNNRKVDLDALLDAAGERKADVELAQFTGTKHLIDRAALRPVMRVFGLVKAMLRTKAIATPGVFGERSYLIPLANVEAVDAQLEVLHADLRHEAQGLAGRYEAEKARQQQKLGPLFVAGDYLPPSAVAGAFSIDWSYVSFAAPDRLETVSHVLAQRAHAKHEAKLATAFEEVMLILRQTALDILTDLERKLTPGGGDKPKVLRGTALRDLQEFLANLPGRDLTGDTALADALAKVARRAEGLDVQDLRDSAGLRASLAAVAGEAKAALAALVEEGRRGISFNGSLGL